MDFILTIIKDDDEHMEDLVPSRTRTLGGALPRCPLHELKLVCALEVQGFSCCFSNWLDPS